MQTQLTSPRLLSDDGLLLRVTDLARRERGVSASLIAHLAELDKRKLYCPEGYSSMFTWCTRVLRFSEQEAYGRIKAARAAVRFPIVLDRLADGSLNLTSVVLLSPHLTRENHEELFEAARHKTRREVEELVAALRPLPPVPTIIRRLPKRVGGQLSGMSTIAPNVAAWLPVSAVQPTTAGADSPLQSTEAPPEPTVSLQPPPQPPPPPARHAAVVPLAPDLYKLQVTISGGTERRLRQAQELLRHRLPDGNPAEILDRALELLVEKLQKQKFGGLTGRRRRVRKTENGAGVLNAGH